MAEIIKPSSLNAIWAEHGDRIKPTDRKISEGWLTEIPYREHFNFLENRRDTAIAHINQRGIPQWDALTEYIENKSYTQGSNGTIYRCVNSNRGKDPSTHPEYWVEAFLNPVSPEFYTILNGYTASVGDLDAVVNRKYYFTNPARLYLPETAKRGDTIVVSKSPSVTVEVYSDVRGPISTYMGDFDVVEFDIFDEVNFIHNGTKWEVV